MGPSHGDGALPTNRSAHTHARAHVPCSGGNGAISAQCESHRANAPFPSYGFMNSTSAHLLAITHPHNERHSAVDAGAVSPPFPQSVTAPQPRPARLTPCPQAHNTSRRDMKNGGGGLRSGGGGAGWAAPKVWERGDRRGGRGWRRCTRIPHTSPPHPTLCSH